MRAYKKQRREGAPRGRYEWMKVKLLTERQRRCLERAWNRREAKVDKKFLDRKRYLAARTAELQVTVNECNSMSKIRNAMFKDIGVLLAVRDGSDAAASAEPGLNVAETPTTISSTLSASIVYHRPLLDGQARLQVGPCGAVVLYGRP